jgi:hypothetical protein
VIRVILDPCLIAWRWAGPIRKGPDPGSYFLLATAENRKRCYDRASRLYLPHYQLIGDFFPRPVDRLYARRRRYNRFGEAFLKVLALPNAYNASKTRRAGARKSASYTALRSWKNMNAEQPFLELDKKQGTLRLTLGASFGRVLIVLALLLAVLCVGKNPSADQMASLMKTLSSLAKAIL